MFLSKIVAGPEIIDFSASRGSNRLRHIDSLSHGGVHVVRGTLASNDEGRVIGGSQLSVVFQLGEPGDLEWQPADSDRLRIKRVRRGMAHIHPGNTPFFQRWQGTADVLVLAFDQEMVDRVSMDIFGKPGASVRSSIGGGDQDILNALPIWQRELDSGGPGGRLFVESLGKATLVHLFRHYGDGHIHSLPIRGGLGAARLRRVLEYIDAHLADDLSIRELANVVGLSTHHFGLAFRQSTGVPPHRYVTAERIGRAKALLLKTEANVTQIAFAVGFASHGHFSAHFRALVGMSPSRFRLDHL